MSVAEFFANNGPLAQVVGPHYTTRAEQVRLATDVAQAISTGETLLAEELGTDHPLFRLVDDSPLGDTGPGLSGLGPLLRG